MKRTYYFSLIILLLFILTPSVYSYQWGITDLFREKVRESFLVGSIYYHDDDEFRFEGRDNALTHIFADYQQDPTGEAIFNGGIIFPFLSNKQLEKTHFQLYYFFLHSQASHYSSSADIMNGLKITIGNWEYYEKNGANAVTGDGWIEFAVGYLSPSHHSMFTFNSVTEKTNTDPYDPDKKRYYYELNFPFINISSFFKTAKGQKDITGLGYNYFDEKKILGDIEFLIEKVYDYGMRYTLNVKGLLNWFNFKTELSHEKGLVYQNMEIDHLFLFRGDARGEKAYFSKKYAWAFGLRLTGGLYYPENDAELIEYFKTNPSVGKKYVAGIEISVQMPFLIFLDSLLVGGGAVLVVSAFIADIPLFILAAMGGETWEFYLTRMALGIEGALIEDIGRQYDRDVWRENVTWCRFNIGVQYNDRESILHNPNQLDKKYNGMFFYGKLDIFF